MDLSDWDDTGLEGYDGDDRRSPTANVRELHALERRITSYIREIEGSVSKINQESTRLENLAKQYNDIREAQNKTMKIAQGNRVDLDVLCSRDDWWSDLKSNIGWVFGIIATTFAILQYIGLLG